MRNVIKNKKIKYFLEIDTMSCTKNSGKQKKIQRKKNMEKKCQLDKNGNRK